MPTTVSEIEVDVAELAGQVDLPFDSLLRFFSANYYPLPKQVLFHAACRAADELGKPNRIAYGGALGGGKTHCAFSQIAIDDCQRFPNLKVLFLRKIAKYGKESLDDMRRSVLKNTSHDFRNNIIHYENQSRIIIGSYQYEKDIDNYLSLEYDIILIEQAEQLSGKKIALIETRNRSSKGFRPRMYYTFNPGGISHNYLKTKFINPYRNESEADTKFIFANYQDNAFLNPEYKQTLDNLTGWQKAAWRDGDWDIAAGQFFTTFRYDAHSVDHNTLPRPIPANWRVWCALDYGFTHYTVCYLLASADGITYVLDEHAERRQLVPHHATAIKALLDRWGVNLSQLSTFVAGADVFAQKGDSRGETIAEQYAREGINLYPANNERIAGASKILELLGDVDRQIEPRLKISTLCPRLLECLPALQHNPNRPEDVLKIDTDEDGQGGDDFYDAFRYGVATTESAGFN